MDFNIKNGFGSKRVPLSYARCGTFCIRFRSLESIAYFVCGGAISLAFSTAHMHMEMDLGKGVENYEEKQEET